MGLSFSVGQASGSTGFQAVSTQAEMPVPPRKKGVTYETHPYNYHCYYLIFALVCLGANKRNYFRRHIQYGRWGDAECC